MIVWTITRVTESFVPVSAVSFTIRVGTPGVGVPDGGTTGQVLRKASATDYDTEWGGVTAASITDSTATGRAVLTAASAAAARAAISAGDALTTGTLGQFAATTSAQLAGVLTDETGSGGGFVRATSPTLTSPTFVTPVLSGATAGRVAIVTTGGVVADNAGLTYDTATGTFRAGTASGGVTLGYDGANYGLIGTPGSFLSMTASQAIDLISGSTLVSPGNVRTFCVRSGRVGVPAATVVGWNPGVDPFTAFDTALARNAAGVVEVNNGTAGQFRDLTLRNLTASGQVIAPSGSAAAPGVAIGASATGLYRVGLGASADIAFSVAATQIGSIGSGGLSVVTYTVATLPSASANAGRLAQVTDSSVTTNGSAVAGGGANRVVVFSNGTNWKVVVA